jgi:hypothetical protein
MTEGTSRQASGRPDGLWGLTADQQWGVPAAADGGTQFMVKNGWLPSGSTGVWEINSIGAYRIRTAPARTGATARLAETLSLILTC